ncbi:MAG: hypothetical protein K1W04_01285 [Oscillospiraceae bacterium]
MDSKEAEYFLSVIESVSYDRNAFTVWYGDDKIILGAIMHDNPEAQRFFDYATIYQTIIDLDRKIKISLKMAIDSAEVISFEEWKPIDPPSEMEKMAIYYTENAIFRTSVLWDLLAQVFNLKETLGKPFEKVYATQLFHDAQQGKHPHPFAVKVYSYMQQQDNSDTEHWEGNYAYVKEFRDKMTHRSSPNISSFSNFALELRMPMMYVLKRVIEDYKQVSEFISEIIEEILSENYEGLNQMTPEKTQGI